MNNPGNNTFGIKFDEDSATSMMAGSAAGGNPSLAHALRPPVGAPASNYDAAEAAVAKLGSIINGQAQSGEKPPKYFLGKVISSAVFSPQRSPPPPPTSYGAVDSQECREREPRPQWQRP